MINHKKDWSSIRSEIIERQITLGIEAIFCGVFSGPNPATQSFHHILNRVMTVAQVPITFIVYREEAGIFSQVYVANKHKRHRLVIEDRYRNVGEHAGNLFPLWGSDTNHRMLVLHADPDYHFNVVERIKSIADVNDALSAASYMLHRIFDSAAYDACGDRFSGYLKAPIEKFSHIDSGKKLSPRPIRDDLKKIFDQWLMVNATAYDVKGRGILDRVFSKLEKNILLITHANGVEANDEAGEPLTNFILFVRDYDSAVNYAMIADGGRGRYGGDYWYNLRIIIGSKQRAEIKRHLIGWVTIEAAKRKREQRYERQIETVDGAAKNLAQEVSALFWRRLCEIDDDRVGEEKYIGIEKVISNLTEYFGDSRSMADPVFDGVSFFRTPFAHDGGMGRCFRRSRDGSPEEIPSSIESLSAEKINDLLRIVTCQYLFESMAASSQGEDDLLQVMLNPLEVGGRVWGVVGYVTRSDSARNQFHFDDEDEEIAIERIRRYHAFWMQNYHVAENVNERMKKNLRTYMNGSYEWFVATTYAKWVAARVGESVAGEPLAGEPQLAELNNLLLDLTRVFPYDAVQMVKYDPGLSPPGGWEMTWFVPRSRDVLEGDARSVPGGVRRIAPEEARVVPLALGRALAVQVEPWSSFHDAPGGHAKGFVDEIDVAVAMTDAMQAKVLSIAVEYEQHLKNSRAK